MHAMDDFPPIRGASGWLLTEATPDARMEALERPPGVPPSFRYCGQSWVEYVRRKWLECFGPSLKDQLASPSPPFINSEMTSPSVLEIRTPLVTETPTSREAAARGDVILAQLRRASFHKLLAIPPKVPLPRGPPPKTIISYP